MSSDSFSDEKIIDSWQKNVLPWTTAVREGQIDSRRQITDRAIVEAVVDCTPQSVLDLGCGEGWLARELASRHIDVVGVDVVPGLIEAARRAGGGDFRTLSYEAIAAGQLELTVDSVVCNFSLLGKESVAGLFAAAPLLLKPRGHLIVQTLHPLFAGGDGIYGEGWRAGSWAGFSSEFTDPAPWYFRTLNSWIKLFADNGFQLLEIREPLHPKNQRPASMLFIGQIIDPISGTDRV